jgi:hypothetical protein
LPIASATNTGKLSATDWTTFNNKVSSSSLLTLLSSAYPFALAGNATSTLTQFNGGLTAYASTTIGNGTQAGGLSINGGATTTGNLAVLGTGTSTFAGDIRIAGSIVPTTANTYSLGSITNTFKDVYIGPASLFVNGQEVLHTDGSNNVVVSSSINQNLVLQTTGSANIELNPSGTGQLLVKSGILLTGGKNFNTSDNSAALFPSGIAPGSLSITGHSIAASDTNGSVFITPNGSGGTYITLGNVGIGNSNPAEKLNVQGAVAAQYFTSTSTTASTFPYASSTVLSVSGSLYTPVTSALLKTDSAGKLIAATPGTDYQAAGAYATFTYPFPSNATTTQIAFNGGLTAAGATTTALAVTGSSTVSAILNVGGAINANGGVVGNLVGNVTGNVTGNVSGNAGTVTNGVYTTTFNALFDPRFITDLAATTSVASIITLPSLLLPYSQLTGTPAIAGYPFAIAGNATSTLTQFNGGLTAYASTTIGSGTQIGGLTISGGATTTGNAYFASRIGVGTQPSSRALEVSGTARVSSTFTLGSVASCTGSQALQTNGSGDVACGSISVSGASTGGGWSTDSIGSITLATSTDRVAIGATTTPYAKLTVLSGDVATTTLALLPASGQTANIIDIYDSATGELGSVLTASGYLGLGTTTPANRLAVSGGVSVGSDFNYPAPTNGLIVQGNVGIGSTDPNGDLLGAQTSGVLTVQNASGNTQQGKLQLANRTDGDEQTVGVLDFVGSSQTDATSLQVASIAAHLSGSTANNRGSYIAFSTRQDGGPNVIGEVARIDSLGNFGLGTTTAFAKLTVEGDIFAETDIAAAGTVSASTICLAGDCRSSWPVAGSTFAYPFPSNATSTSIAFNGGLTASTIVATNATTTNLFSSIYRGNQLAVGGTATTSIDSAGNLLVQGGTSAGTSLDVNGTANALYYNVAGSQFIDNNKDANIHSVSINGGQAVIDSAGVITSNATAANTLPYASSTAITVSGALYTPIASSLLKTDAAGKLVAAVLGTDYQNFAYLFPSNATSTSIAFNGGLTASTITTSGSVGVGTNSPGYALDVAGFINTDVASGYKQGGSTVLFASSTTFSLAVGAPAAAAWMAATSSVLYNTAIGVDALKTAPLSSQGANNTAIGYNTLSHITIGSGNFALGANALANDTTGQDNFALGASVLYNNNGSYNIGIGAGSLVENTTGDSNVSVGRLALQHNTTGSANVSIGAVALNNATSTVGNTAIGNNAGAAISGALGAAGNYNTLVGYQAGFNITTGGNNTLLGYFGNSGGITTGGDNILIGDDVRAGLTPAGSNQLNIGNLLFGSAVGSGATLATGNIGVGTSSPFAKLSVAGDIFANGNITGSNVVATGTLAVVGQTTLSTASSTALTATSLYSTNASTTNLNISSINNALLSTSNGGVVGATTISSPLSFSGTTLSISQANGSQNGYLSSTDWNIFNSKISSTSLSSANGLLTYDSSTGIFVASTSPTFTAATTTSLGITGIASALLKTTASGGVVAAVLGTDYQNFAYPFPNNATTTALGLYASTTIGNGSAGLTVSGNATTTGTAYFAGNVGIGTTSPYANLAVHAKNGSTNTTLFAIASSTASATTTLFAVDNVGTVNASNYYIPSALTSGAVGILSNAALQFNTANEFNFLFASTNRVQIGSSYVSVNSGGSYRWSSTSNGNGSADTQISRFSAGVLQIGTTAANANGTLVAKSLSVGSTTPFGALAVSLNDQTNYTGNNAFIIASSTASATTTLFSVSNTGTLTLGGNNSNGLSAYYAFTVRDGSSNSYLTFGESPTSNYRQQFSAFGIVQSSAAVYGFASGGISASGSSGDTAISRLSAGVMAFGTGAQGSTAGGFIAATSTLGNLTVQNTATTTNLAITAVASTLLKTNSLGQVVAAVLGTDYQNFAYLFPSNATTTQIAFNGGATFTGATSTALAVTGSTTISSILNVGGAINANGGIVGNLTGNASTATVLQNARTINGVSFNGSADITVTAAAGTLTGTALNATVVTSSLTSVGTLSALAVSGNTSLANASTTNISSSYASSTNLVAGNLVVGSLSGILKATAGLVSVATPGTDYLTHADIFDYPFPSNATTTSIAFNGGLTASTLSVSTSGSIASTTLTGNTLLTNATTTNLGITGISNALLKTSAGSVVAATPGTDYEVPLTFSTGLLRSGNTVTNTIGYPFPSNATTTSIAFNGGLTASTFSVSGNTTLATTTLTNATSSNEFSSRLTANIAAFGGTASTTIDASGNLVVGGGFSGAGLGTCNSSTDKLQWAGGTFSCGVDLNTGGGGSGGFSFTTYYGATTAATSSALWAQGGLFASSTSHFSLADFVEATSTNLSASVATFGSAGTGTTTIDAQGRVGIGTTSPTQKLAVAGGNILQVAIGNPTLAAATTTTSKVYATAVAGRLAYVAEYGNGLRIMDVSNPKSPKTVGTLGSIGNALSVAVAGRYAYVGTESGLKIIDVTNAAAPAVVGTYASVSFAYGVVVSGKYAYVTDDGNGLRILDISNPAAPTLVGSYLVGSSNPYALAVSGRYAYMGNQSGVGNTTYIIDISNPTAPALAGGYAGGVAPAAYAVSGKYLYVADSGGGFYMLDVSNPAAPALAGTYNGSGVYYGVAAAGDYAYLSNFSGKAQVVDVSNPASINLAGEYSFSGTPWAITLAGKYLYVADNDQGLKIVDINGATFPSANIGSLESNTANISDNLTVGNNISAGGSLNVGISGIFSRGTISAYIASSTQVNPVVASFMGGNVGVGTTSPFATLSVAGDAFITGGATTTNLAISTVTSSLLKTNALGSVVAAVAGVDYSNFAYPFAVAGNATSTLTQFNGGLTAFASTTIGDGTTIGGLTINGGATTTGQAYFAGNVGIGSSTPGAKLAVSGGNIWQTAGNPVIASSTDTTSSVADVFVSGRYAYLAENGTTDGLAIYDVQNPAAPIKVGSFTTANSTATQVLVSGKYAYHASATGVQIIDVSNPSSPIAVNSTLFGIPGAIALSGKYLYVAGGANPLHPTCSIRTYDISNPTAPTFSASLSIGVTTNANCTSIAVSGNYAYIGDTTSSGRLYIVDISNPVSPILIKAFTTTNSVSQVYVSGRYAYLAKNSTTGGLQIVDISNPASPVSVASFNTTNVVKGIKVAGNYAYLAENSTTGGVQVVDVSTPSTPVAVGTFTTANAANKLFVSGKYVYVATNGTASGFQVLDANGASLPLASIGNLNTTDLNVDNSSIFGGDLYAQGGLNVGLSGIFSRGTISAYVASSTQVNPTVANFMGGGIGVGTTSPQSLLAASNYYGSTFGNLFSIASSTAADGSTANNLFTVSNTGNVDVGAAGSVNINQYGAYKQAGNSVLYASSTLGSIYVGNAGPTAYNASATNNTFLGANAGNLITSGANNTLIGSWSTGANSNLTTGSNNIALGYNISFPSATANGQLDIQNIIYGTGNTGAGSTASTGNVGIASSTPWARLSVDTSSLAANVPEFAVGSSTRTDLVVTQAGNVGVGTTNPSALFTVNGAAAFAGAITSTATAANVLPYASSTALTATNLYATSATLGSLSGVLKATAGLVSAASNGTDYTLITANTCTNQLFSAVTAAGVFTCASVTNAMITNSTIDLTTKVTGILPIANGGTNASSFTTINNSVYYDGTRLVTSGTSQAVTTPYASSTALTVSGSAYLGTTGSQNVGIGATTTPWAKFSIDTTSLAAGVPSFAVGSSTRQDLVITQAGNVGVGTASPIVPLTVNGRSGVAGAIAVTNSDFSVGSAGSALLLGPGTSSGNTYEILDAYTAGGTGGILALNSSGGNVGIGTTTAGGNLVINGTTGKNFLQVASSTNQGIFVVNASGNVGIGTTNPGTKLTISTNAAALPTAPAGTVVQLGAADSASSIVSLDSFGNNSSFKFRRADGTAASPSAVQSGESLGSIAFSGYGTSYNDSSGAKIEALAAETWTGSTQASILTFSTRPSSTVGGSTERLRIDQNGNVGVGSTTPWGRLSVDTTSLAAGVPEFTVGSSTRHDFVITQAGNVGIGTTTPGSVNLRIGDGTANKIVLVDGGSSGSGNGASYLVHNSGQTWGAFGNYSSIFGGTFTNQMALYTPGGLTIPSGNVGIGTTSPTTKLQVTVGASGVLPTASIAQIVAESNTSAGIQIINPDNQIGRIIFGTPSASSGAGAQPGISALLRWDYTNKNFQLGTDQTNGFLTFSTNQFQERMRIDSSGNVGIGTTTPAVGNSSIASLFDTTFQVHGNNNKTVGANIELSSNNTASGVYPGSLEFSVSGISATERRAGYIAALTSAVSGSTVTGGLEFGTNNGGTVGARMSILGSGLVGIASTTPFARLSLQANYTDTNKNIFAIGSSTNSGGTTNVSLFTVDNTGITTIGDPNATGDSNMQFAADANAWSVGYYSSDKSFRIASSTNLANNPALIINKGGGIRINNAIMGGTRFGLAWDSSSEQGIVMQTSSGTFTTNPILFLNSSAGLSGYIGQSASAVTYNTSSDRRIKENLATSTVGLDALMQLPVYSFDFINDPSHASTTGFIAQELYKVFPYAVSTNGDNGLVALGATSTPWSVDYGRVTPLIVSAVQDLNLKVEALIATTTATTSPQNALFAASFWSKVKSQVGLWLADAHNGIANLFAETITANVVNAKELCLADDSGSKTCVTKAQLDALLSSHGAGNTTPPPAGGGDTGSTGGDTGTTTPPGGDTGTTTPDVPVPADPTPPAPDSGSGSDAGSASSTDSGGGQ